MIKKFLKRSDIQLVKVPFIIAQIMIMQSSVWCRPDLTIVAVKGRTIRKVMGGRGWGKSKKNRAERKRFVHQENLKNKFVQRLFNRENYKLKSYKGLYLNKLSTQTKSQPPPPSLF